MNPPQEGYEHLNTPWMNMKVGDLVSIVWTEGCETPAIVGVITALGPHERLEFRNPHIMDKHKRQLEHLARQKIEVLNQGKTNWFERGDLRVIA